MSRVKPLLSIVSNRVVSRRCMCKQRYNTTVCSTGLDQIESRCERIPEIPLRRLRKVTVIGAATDIGLITSLFLKQHNVIKYLAMYDDWPRRVVGHAHDIAHIDTSVAVEAYQGRLALVDALKRADVVVICGGYYPTGPDCFVPDTHVFFSNARYVRSMVNAVAINCPKAILCIQVPPVDPMFNMCRHTLKHFRVYDRTRLLGLNSVNAMRANQLLCEHAGTDPAGSYCPCVGGTCYCTRVPVFSTMKDYKQAVCNGIDKIAEFPRFVREADRLVCRIKCKEEQAHLSIGFSTARAVVSIMHGLFERGGLVDSALVEQPDPEACYGLKVCACPVAIGRDGISSYQVPKLNPQEEEMLQKAKEYLDEYLYMGKCFALGNEYRPPDCRCVWQQTCVDCPYAEKGKIVKRKVTVIGAASDIGLITSLFLKQHNVIKYLAMYDDWPRRVVGHAHDIAHIDTSVAVEAYQGRLALGDALKRADVVVICGGYYPTGPDCFVPDTHVFFSNARYVRSMVNAVAINCPKAILCIQVPPVDPIFNMCRHTLKHFRVYDRTRLLGLNSVNAMRANQLLCEHAGTDPAGSYCPCVGGTCYCTRVPVFSAMKDYKQAVRNGMDKIAEFPRFVREADRLVCRIKCKEEQAHLSIGFSTARAVVSIMHGLFERGGLVDSALVEQPNPQASYGLKVCACPVAIGRDGISSCQIPKLNPQEGEMLQKAKEYLEEYLYMGKCFALGDEYRPSDCRCVWQQTCHCVDCPYAEKGKIVKRKVSKN